MTLEQRLCRHRVHCYTCRNDARWRMKVGAPIICPLGFDSGKALIEQTHAQTALARTPEQLKAILRAIRQGPGTCCGQSVVQPD